MSPAAQTDRHALWQHLPARPWKYTGYSREVYQACPGAPVQVGGSCDHCSTGIMDTFHFEAPETGEKFKVGSTCVGKMLKEMKTRSLSAAMVAIRRQRNAKARERAAVRREARKAEATALIETVRDTASALPHPQEWRAKQGDTLTDWAEWMLKNGGEPAYKAVIKRLAAVAS